MTKTELIEDARSRIEVAISHGGQYCHNIVSCILGSVARNYGKKEANKLVRELDLTELFGIPQEK